MNTVNENQFVAQITLESTSQLDVVTGDASYKLECPEWLKLTSNAYEVALTKISLPIHAIDMCGGGECFIEINRQTIGQEYIEKCVFESVSAGNPVAFVKELCLQMKECEGFLRLFGSEDDIPYLAYSANTQRASVHFRDASTDLTRPSLMRLSPMLCKKLGFWQVQQPFTSRSEGTPVNQPIVGYSEEPLYIHAGNESFTVSTPHFVPHGILVNSTWSSGLASFNIDCRPSLGSFGHQHKRAHTAWTVWTPTFFKCPIDNIRNWRVDILGENQKPVTWIYPNLSITLTLQFRKCPTLDFI